MSSIAAGSFSGSLSKDNGHLFIWGSGHFGEFLTPQRVRSGVEKVQISRGFILALTKDELFSWGENSKGQLGLRDFQA